MTAPGLMARFAGRIMRTGEDGNPETLDHQDRAWDTSHCNAGGASSGGGGSYSRRLTRHRRQSIPEHLRVRESKSAHMSPREVLHSPKPPPAGEYEQHQAFENTPDSLDNFLTDMGGSTPTTPAAPKKKRQFSLPPRLSDLSRARTHKEGSIASSTKSSLVPRVPRRAYSDEYSRPRPHDADGNDHELGDALNEKLVKQPRDQLFFSRKARPVSNFQPYTLDQYRLVKPEKYYELGKLQPDLNREDLVAKRKNIDRVKEFSRKLRAMNAKELKTQPWKHRAPVPAGASKRDRALQFAKKIPKPKVQPKPKPEEDDNVLPRTKRESERKRKVDSEELGSEDDAACVRLSRFEQLEAKHYEMRAIADDIRRQFYGR